MSNMTRQLFALACAVLPGIGCVNQLEIKTLGATVHVAHASDHEFPREARAKELVSVQDLLSVDSKVADVLRGDVYVERTLIRLVEGDGVQVPIVAASILGQVGGRASIATLIAQFGKRDGFALAHMGAALDSLIGDPAGLGARKLAWQTAYDTAATGRQYADRIHNTLRGWYLENEPFLVWNPEAQKFVVDEIAKQAGMPIEQWSRRK